MVDELTKQTTAGPNAVPTPTKPVGSNYNVTVYLPASTWFLSYDTDQIWLEGTYFCFVDKATGNKIVLTYGSTVVITGILNFPSPPPA